MSSPTLQTLLEAALSIERESEDLKTTLRDRFKEEERRESAKLATLEKRLRGVETQVDNALARLTRGEETLALLESKLETSARTGTASLQQEAEKLARVEGGYERLQALIALTNDPQATFPTPPLTFVLDKYDERKAEDEKWCSPPFYSGVSGYKMCLQVYPNGQLEGKGSHVSLFLALLPGEFDDLLQWPFCGRVTVHLINHRRGANISHTISLTSDESLSRRQRPNAEEILDPVQAPSWGTRTFTEQQTLLPGGYWSDREFLKKDCLTFRVWSVDVFNRHH